MSTNLTQQKYLPTITKAEPHQLTRVLTIKPNTELAVLPENTKALFRRPPGPKPAPLQKLPPKKIYAAEGTIGVISKLFGENLEAGNRIEIELPLGTPRYVLAKTLRKLLGGRRGDTLMSWNGTAWEICPSQMRIDLTDTNRRFRMGAVAVLS